MYNTWQSNPANALWDNWPTLGPVEGLWRSAFVDNTKMADAIGLLVDNRPFKRMIAI